ncbi:hypothetical protein EDC39_11464 [Geothermobacter ehrlichii]|uniref:UPF0235 protein EDC39_11464 n=1 Tax=Geothermobacter ehrlichii TaxID=213224 RepID=A0A5D3WJ18_9BACT|nr:DUF167 family protein [Geothermobacter ehrlichii]TYO96358.1 hypothetical protein EDC39_11464 [Geothermobacter ehrlichii]
MPCVESRADGVVLKLLVQPRASRNRIVGLQGEELKVALTSPPVDGAANRLCIRFFAKMFGLPRSGIEILSGETSRHKRLLLKGLSEEEVRRLLELRAG